jgi:hypothetical protein
VTNVNKRLSADEVLNHPWLSSDRWGFNAKFSSPKKNISSDSNLKKEAIVKYFENLGFSRDYVLQSMNKNLFNHIKACYESLNKLLNN